VQVLSSRKPLLAAADCDVPDISIEARTVTINSRHLQRYRDVCGIEPSSALPHAYPHVLAMPLHMRVFTHPQFPVKVLGLVHLRNVIRQRQAIPTHAPLKLSVRFNTVRETSIGQEYDLVTVAEVAGQPVWEEVSTMLARRMTHSKRPTIERAQRDEAGLIVEQTVVATAETGRRYAWVSGDFNPIHLFDRTAQWFHFKQTVAHGMWSLARCIGLAERHLPKEAIELDAQFKLPIYLPSDFIFRAQRTETGAALSLSTTKGDRLHLTVKASRLPGAIQ
jgi:acyl dehydratase